MPKIHAIATGRKRMLSTSGLASTPDMALHCMNRRYGPTADSCIAASSVLFDHLFGTDRSGGLLGQSRSPQPLFISRDIVEPRVRPKYVFEAGDTQCWIERSQPCDGYLCRLQQPDERLACGDDA